MTEALVLFIVAAFLLLLVSLTYFLAFIEAHVPGVKSFLDDYVGEPPGWDE